MILLTINKEVQFYEQYIKHTNVIVIYKTLHSKILKAIRQLHLKTGMGGFSIWYTSEFKLIVQEQNESIIFFDTILTLPAVNYLCKRNGNLRVIYWFWNHIYNPEVLHLLPENIEKWSYDIEDCKQYNLEYNTQFHFKEIGAYDSVNYSIEQDFLFVGAEKGRMSYINQCADLIDNAKLSKKFFVIDYSNKLKKSTSLPYPHVLELVRHSKCVVDIMPDVQKGISLRPLEALMMGKKLITNFTAIQDMSFYCKENVFIIGNDNPKDLTSFMMTPVDIDFQLKSRDYYDFNSWIKRFNR